MFVLLIIEKKARGVEWTKAILIHRVAHAEALRLSRAVDRHRIPIQSNADVRD